MKKNKNKPAVLQWTALARKTSINKNKTKTKKKSQEKESIGIPAKTPYAKFQVSISFVFV